MSAASSSPAAVRPAAFFDLDHTLIAANSGSQWMKYLYRRGEAGVGLLLKASYWTIQYRLAILDMETVGRRLVRTIEGDPEAGMRERCADFVPKHLVPAITAKARAALDEHRQLGHPLVMLTSATQFVAEPLAELLQIPHVLCSRLEVERGLFTGACGVPLCYGEGKVVHAERLAEREQIDLSASYFYTDSYSDLPMLKRVGHPRVINPDRRLRRHAVRARWPVDIWQ